MSVYRVSNEKFFFTKEEKVDLLTCWDKSSDRQRECAKKYIEAVQPIIAHWVFIDGAPQVSQSKLNSEINQVGKDANRLLNRLDDLSDGSKRWLSIQMSGQLIKSNETLTELSEACAALVAISSGPHKRGPTNRNERLIISFMDDEYIKCFGKVPGYYEQCPFHEFIRKLSSILGLQISPETIEKSKTTQG